METIPNKFAIAALKERRAAIDGEIMTLESRLRYFRKMADAVDNTIRLLSPDFDPAAIRPKKPNKRVRLFATGELNRLIFDAMRKAGGPQTIDEITDAIIAELGHGQEARASLKHRVQANLCYLLRAGIGEEGRR